MILVWLDDAQGSGARLAPACSEVDLNPRTIQRWRSCGGGDDRRHGPKSTPRNKLSASERQQVLDVANSPEYRDLSPKQIVPKLADQKSYVASESTFYRVLRQENQLGHRWRAKAPSSRPPAEQRATGPG